MDMRLVVSVNSEVKLEYDRARLLEPEQQLYLDKMDIKMDQGFEYNGEFFANPDQTKRAQFVTVNLIHALLSDNEQNMAAMCSYLAVRLPDLKQVQAVTHGEAFSVDLIFDQVFANTDDTQSQHNINVEFKPNVH